MNSVPMLNRKERGIPARKASHCGKQENGQRRTTYLTTLLIFQFCRRCLQYVVDGCDVERFGSTLDMVVRIKRNVTAKLELYTNRRVWFTRLSGDGAGQ